MPKTKKTPKAKQTQVELPRWKTVEEMTGPEVVREAESLASYAEGCRDCQQGINTKEVIRFKRCLERIEAERLAPPFQIVELHERWNPGYTPMQRKMMLGLFENGGTLEGMRKLFAPA